MINDVEMLTYVLQNAEMGCQGITCVRKDIKDSEIDGVLCEQLVKYGKIYHCANNMLRNRGEEIHHVSPMTKAMTRVAASRDLKRDSSASHIAEMMIKGNTMGVNKMARHIRNYEGNDESIKMLARKMLDTEEENIREMKSFIG
ncbi:MAG: hypothetical protein MJ089_02300 [Ruminococcus sp.]|nr:hypothetical protein [Ruminococcus sp.]